MSDPQRPHTLLVARAWLEVATPAAVRAGDALPAADASLRTDGFIRLRPTGGAPSVENPMRHPVVAAECFVAPAEGSQLVPWNRAGRLAEWVMSATENRAYMGVRLDLGAVLGAAFAGYAPVRVHTVVPLNEPARVEDDPNYYARFDVDLHLHWSIAT